MDVLNMLIPMVIKGLRMTLGVFFITLVFSLPLSIVVARLRLSKNLLISRLTAVYIYLMRGTPLLLQMMFIFFGLPELPGGGLVLGREMAIYVAFILNYTAYFAEIFRGGIQSIDQGQWEAGEVLGLSRLYTFKKIILPQVIKNILPSLSNEIITLVKDTSLVFSLGVMDVLKAAKATAMRFSTLSPYLYVGGVYLILVAVLTRLLDRTEEKFSYYR
ncbi:MAG: amino acid ABC transporter permease [Tissierellia bacterium]|nr:amino acid ABC transporter permease [Tissierellia bacterium]